MLQKYGASACIPAGAFSVAKIVILCHYFLEIDVFVTFRQEARAAAGIEPCTSRF